MSPVPIHLVCPRLAQCALLCTAWPIPSLCIIVISRTSAIQRNSRFTRVTPLGFLILSTPTWCALSRHCLHDIHLQSTIAKRTGLPRRGGRNMGPQDGNAALVISGGMRSGRAESQNGGLGHPSLTTLGSVPLAPAGERRVSCQRRCAQAMRRAGANSTTT